MIIVAAYRTQEEALLGHFDWVERLSTEPPDELNDVGNSGISRVCIMLAGPIVLKKVPIVLKKVKSDA